MSATGDEALRKELKEEYQLLQSQYEDFDRRSLTIKGWISFASVAAIALGFDSAKNPKEIWLIVAVICASIWYLEARWKTFQYAFRDRIRIIEAYFRNEADLLEKAGARFRYIIHGSSLTEPTIRSILMKGNFGRGPGPSAC